MDRLFTDYRILWDKRKKTPKRHKAAIKADLETMTKTIDEAMIYTRDKVLTENRETEVRFWLNTDTPVSYYLDMHYAPDFEAWNLIISNEDHEPVAEIVSDKWPSLQISQNEDVETENVDR